MADIALQPRMAKAQIREATTWDQIKTNRNWLGFWFMLPAMAFLIFFLAYPLGLGIWISFTDAKIGRPGEFIGIENYEWLWGDFDLLAFGLQYAALHDRSRARSNSRSASILRCC